MTRRVVIIGGGISGLALAYRLQQAVADIDITVLERSGRVGGTVWTVERDGFRVECGANGFLDNKPSTLELCHDLGLADRLVAASETARRNRYLFLNGRLQRLPTSLGGFIKDRVLSWRGKLDLLAEPLRRRRDGGDESVHAFFRRRLGREAAETLGEAIVTGIFAGDARVLSARACFPRLVGLEERYGSLMLGMLLRAKPQAASRTLADSRAGLARGAMWSFREGMRVLIERLAGTLRKAPVLGVSVRRLSRHENSWRVHGDGADAWDADVVVLACPAYQQANLLEDIDGELAKEVRAIPYNRIAVVALGYRDQDLRMKLDGFGFLSGPREGLDVLGAQWCSSIYPERAPPGMVLLRAMCGGWSRPEVAAWEDERLRAAVRRDCARTMQITAEPVFQHIVRWERAIPQYLIGHGERVARIEAMAGKYPGLVLAGNAYHGVALNDCVEQAGRVAHGILAALHAARSPAQTPGRG